MKQINQIATSFKESIFSEISQLAIKHNAINLSQGFPNFMGPEWVNEFAKDALNQVHLNQYSPSNGAAGLVANIIKNYQDFYGLSYKNSEVTVTTGCTEALFCSGLALLNPGDEVILFEPFYDSYPAIAQLAGAKLKYVTLNMPDFHINEEDLLRAITPKSKLIFLNNPHNPTGRVFSKEELEIVARVAKTHDLYVISDEVYEHLVYDRASHIPIATLEGMKERTLTLSSLGKTFGLTGWKIGWACGPENLTSALRNIHQFSTFCAPHPFQYAAGKALQELNSYLPEFKKLYQEKRNLFIKGIEKTILKPINPQGTYFMLVETPGQKDDVQYCSELITQYNVATIPPSSFYSQSDEGKKMLRFCFAKDDDTLNQALNNLSTLIQG